jgi:hypothetical protein
MRTSVVMVGRESLVGVDEVMVMERVLGRM